MWQNIDIEPTIFGSKQINPQKYKVLKLDVASIKSFLNKTPLEFTIAAKGISSFLELPLPDGKKVSNSQQLINLTFIKNLKLLFANFKNV
jgi:hypothetical protein